MAKYRNTFSLIIELQSTIFEEVLSLGIYQVCWSSFTTDINEVNGMSEIKYLTYHSVPDMTWVCNYTRYTHAVRY